MPFKSKAQRRLFYAMKDRGEMDQATIDRWEEHTPKKKLPEHVPHQKESAFYEMGKLSACQKLALSPAFLEQAAAKARKWLEPAADVGRRLRHHFTPEEIQAVIEQAKPHMERIYNLDNAALIRRHRLGMP